MFHIWVLLTSRSFLLPTRTTGTLGFPTRSAILSYNTCVEVRVKIIALIEIPPRQYLHHFEAFLVVDGVDEDISVDLLLRNVGTFFPILTVVVIGSDEML